MLYNEVKSWMVGQLVGHDAGPTYHNTRTETKRARQEPIAVGDLEVFEWREPSQDQVDADDGRADDTG